MKNLGDLLSASAARNPQKAAIAFEDRSISYESLEQATTRPAQWFLQQGCKPGDRIAFHWPNSMEAAELYFACFKAGLIALPVNVLMKAHELAYVLEHSKAVMCFARSDLAHVAMEAGRSCALRAIHTAVESLNKGELEVQLPEVNLSDPAPILYTSGTTALPKGVTKRTCAAAGGFEGAGENCVPGKIDERNKREDTARGTETIAANSGVVRCRNHRLTWWATRRSIASNKLHSAIADWADVHLFRSRPSGGRERKRSV